MWRTLSLIAATAVVVALPFRFQRPDGQADWRHGDPVLVIVTPHNEAIRHEFGRAFSRWHAARYGQPVKVDWRVIGGTTEIMRYLESEYVAAARAWWLGQGRPWPAGAGEALLDRKFDDAKPPPASDAPGGLRRWEEWRDLRRAFRATDDAHAFTCNLDLFFGGGAYDHGRAAGAGLTVPPWPAGAPPPDTLTAPDGRELIPAALGGEIWRTATFFGAALSTFGICYNTDRLRDLGIAQPPRTWADLTAPALAGQVGVADPTKSGSIAKAFEMIVHEQCWRAVLAAGYSPDDIAGFESAIARAGLPPGALPPEVPADYQAAIERGWIEGIRLLQRIGANARYFTDSAGKVPIDVSVGDAAAGVAIDFYGRYQAETSRGPDGRERMGYVTPTGGSSVSADPISLLRGAEHRELAVRFITFVLGAEGQALWNYAPGAPGGPERFALRRLPIRRDFYPSDDAAGAAAFATRRPYLVDDLGAPDVNPFLLAGAFVYQPRWTGAHFSVLRDLVRVMCLDSGDELRAAWRAILAAGGPARQPRAMDCLARLPQRPEPLTWRSALTIPRNHARMDYLRDWTLCYREHYAAACRAVDGERDGGRP